VHADRRYLYPYTYIDRPKYLRVSWQCQSKEGFGLQPKPSWTDCQYSLEQCSQSPWLWALFQAVLAAQAGLEP